MMLDVKIVPNSLRTTIDVVNVDLFCVKSAETDAANVKRNIVLAMIVQSFAV